MPPCVQYDDLWPGGPRFARSGAGFALGTDSVLLAAFAADRRVRRFADLGCGAGVLTVLPGRGFGGEAPRPPEATCVRTDQLTNRIEDSDGEPARSVARMRKKTAPRKGRASPCIQP